MSAEAQHDKAPTPHGTTANLSTINGRRAAMDQAFDYRGDVTITLTGGEVIAGYVFDRRADVDPPHIRVMVKDSGQRLTIPYREVERLQFTGRDTAAGKSWQTWVKQYQEKKARGDAANLEPEFPDGPGAGGDLGADRDLPAASSSEEPNST